MEIVFYIAAALLIAGGVVAWHLNKEKVTRYIHGGPIVAEKPSLSSSVDKMHAARDEALAHAAVLERQVAVVRADLAEATSKLIPSAPAEVPKS